MAELTTVSRPYANAVFSLAKREKQLPHWSRMLTVLAAASADPKVRRVLDTPEMAGPQKAQKLIEICSDELDDRARRFVRVLSENQRLDLFQAVSQQYELLKSQEEKTLEVEVISAYPVTDTEIANLKRALEKKYARDVVLASRVDAALIGGAIIRAGDTVIDGSIKGKLDKLAESLLRS
jgi:F-type H+-transporting ATPase subunit delta